MGAPRFLTTLTLALSLSAQVHVHAVDVNSIKDMKCLKNPPTPVHVDMDWATKVGEWYISAGSQLYMYRDASEILNKPIADIAPYELFYGSCLQFLWHERVLISGFGSEKSDIDLKPDPNMGDGWFTFRLPNLGIEGAQSVVTMTDNASYAVFYMCYPDTDEATWALVTVTPSLAEDKLKDVWAHAKAMGFSEKQFTRIRYEACDPYKS